MSNYERRSSGGESVDTPGKRGHDIQLLLIGEVVAWHWLLMGGR